MAFGRLQGLLGRIGGYMSGEGVTEGNPPPANMNNLNQPINNISSLDNSNDYNQTQMANESDNYSPATQLWGQYYQGEQDPTKMAKFEEELGGPENENIRDLVGNVSGVFSEDETGMSAENFENLLYGTGYHESDAISGTPRTSQGYLNDANEWVPEGPAGSYWQVEPSTLRDLVTAKQIGGETNPSEAYWGSKATEATGYSAKDLYNMTDEELTTLLQNPENQILGAVAAGGKYVKSLRADTPVNSTMDNWNRVNDAFNY